MKEKATKESLSLSHLLEAKQEGFLREGRSHASSIVGSVK
jgi:hypothetical protein